MASNQPGFCSPGLVGLFTGYQSCPRCSGWAESAAAVCVSASSPLVLVISSARTDLALPSRSSLSPSRGLPRLSSMRRPHIRKPRSLPAQPGSRVGCKDGTLAMPRSVRNRTSRTTLPPDPTPQKSTGLRRGRDGRRPCHPRPRVSTPRASLPPEPSPPSWNRPSARAPAIHRPPSVSVEHAWSLPATQAPASYLEPPLRPSSRHPPATPSVSVGTTEGDKDQN
jgi:hypothetical protein